MGGECLCGGKRALSFFVYVFSACFFTAPFCVLIFSSFFPVFFFWRLEYILILINSEINNRKTRQCTGVPVRGIGCFITPHLNFRRMRFLFTFFQGCCPFFRFYPYAWRATGGGWWCFRRFLIVFSDSDCCVRSFSVQAQIWLWAARCIFYFCCFKGWLRVFVGLSGGYVMKLSSGILVIVTCVNVIIVLLR